MSTPNENITNIRHEPHIYFIDDIPEDLLKQALVTGNTTDIENYLNGNPALLLREREHLQEIEAIAMQEYLSAHHPKSSIHINDISKRLERV